METILGLVVPVFGIVLAGFLARRFDVLGDDSTEALNRFVYYIALPPLLFLSTARQPIERMLNGPFIGAYAGAAALTVALAVLGARLLFGQRDPATLTLHGMAAVFSNTIYMGIPLFLAGFGPKGLLPILIAALVSNLLFIGTVILLLEINLGARGQPHENPLRVVGAVLFNPIATPLFLGLLAATIKLPLPLPIARFLELLAQIAGPAALFTLGLSLYGHRFVRADLWEMSWLTLMKLVVNPLLAAWLVFHVFALDSLWAQGAVLSAALPTGTLVFVLAQRYDVYVQRSAAVITATTVLSLFTLSALFIHFGVAG